jgi:hypothetical protein
MEMVTVRLFFDEAAKLHRVADVVKELFSEKVANCIALVDEFAGGNQAANVAV